MITKMIKKSIFIISILLSIFSISAVGFHPASEILPGQFVTGDFSFDGNVESNISFNVLNGLSNNQFGYFANNGGFLWLENESGSTNILLRGYGDSYFNSGNVGIGTEIPNARLHIKGDYLRLEELSDIRSLDIYPAVSGNNHRFTSTTTVAGYQFENNVEELMRIENNGNVGIGTDTPLFKLDIDGGIHVMDGTDIGNGIIIFTDNTLDTGKSSVAGFNGGLSLSGSVDATLSPHLYITNGGDVGIGYTSPLIKLDVRDSNAGGYVANFYNTGGSTNEGGIVVRAGPTDSTLSADNWMIKFLTGNGATAGRIAGTGGLGLSYVTSSDRRLKENFKNLSSEEVFNYINNLKAYEFNFKNSSIKMHGLIAQEVRETMPYLVNGNESNGEYLGLDYGKLTPILLLAIKEQNKIIETQQLKIEVIENRLIEIEGKLE